MKILKIILRFKYIFIALISLIYALIVTNIFVNKSKYNIKDTTITGYIHKYNIDNDKINIEIIGKEKIIGTYFIIDKKEKNDFKNNFKLGTKVVINCILEEPKQNTIPNLFNYKNYLYNESIFYIMKIKSIKKIGESESLFYDIKDYIIRKIESINLSNNYVYAFVLGEDYYINKEVKESFRINGISHLFAVSGSNIMFVVILFLKLFDKFKYKYLFVFIYVFFYMFLTDASSSIIRSGIFFVLLTLKKIYKINIKTIDVLLLTLFFSLIYNPYLIYSVGFLYSYIISLFLVVFEIIIKRFKNKISILFITSFISFLCSIPITLNTSFEINFFSVFLNIIYIPFVSIIIFPMSVLCVFFNLLDPILYYLIQLLENSSLFFSEINFFVLTLGKINIFIALIYYIIITYILIKFIYNKYKYIFILIPVFILNSIYNIPINKEVIFIDVNQGDSILIRSALKNVLIDTGGSYSLDNNKRYSLAKDSLIPYFKSLGIKRLNYLILTHGDYDHMGETINLVENFKVEKVIFNCGPYNDLEQELIKVLDKKKIKYYSCIKELNIDKNKLYFLQTKEYDNENDNSNVIYTELNGYKFMFMGDASITTEKEILDKYNLSNIDVLKVGHHGSKTSSSRDFINKMNPKCSIISVGKNNRYDHPKDEVLEILKNSKIYRTDLDGSIEIKLNKNGYKIRTCPP